MDIFTAKQIAVETYGETCDNTTAYGNHKFVIVNEKGESVIMPDIATAREHGSGCYIFKGRIHRGIQIVEFFEKQ